MQKYLLVLAMVLLLAPVSAVAAEMQVCTYRDNQDALVKIIYNTGRARINFENNDSEQLFMLAANGKKWFVLAHNDQTFAFDVDTIDVDAAWDDNVPTAIEPAGERIVGGFTGEAYMVKTERAPRPILFVVTEAAPVVQVYNILAAFWAKVAETDVNLLLNTIEYLNTENGKKYGLLQYGDKMELISFDRQHFAEDYFILPQDVMILGGY